MARNSTPRENPVTGLVPVRLLVSEAGYGLNKGEIRGVSIEVAERMIAAKSAAFDDECEAGVAAAEKAANKRGKPADVDPLA